MIAKPVIMILIPIHNPILIINNDQINVFSYIITNKISMVLLF